MYFNLYDFFVAPPPERILKMKIWLRLEHGTLSLISLFCPIPSCSHLTLSLLHHCHFLPALRRLFWAALSYSAGANQHTDTIPGTAFFSTHELKSREKWKKSRMDCSHFWRVRLQTRCNLETVGKENVTYNWYFKQHDVLSGNLPPAERRKTPD